MLPHVNINLFHHLYVLCFVYYISFRCFFYFLLLEDLFDVFVFIYCVGAGATTLMSISDGLDPYFFRREIEKTRSVKEEMDGEVFILRQSGHFSSIEYMIKVFFPVCTLNWRVSISRQGSYK